MAAGVRILVLVLTGLITACGAATSPASPGTATPSPSPTAALEPTFVGVTVTHAGSVSGALYSLTGQRIGTAPLGAVAEGGRAVTGSNGLYLLSGGALTRVNRDGTVEPLETTLPPTLLGPVVSPDGLQWMYSVVTWDAAGTKASTSVYVDSKAQPHHLLVQLQRSAVEGGGYPPLLWLSQGIVLGAQQVNPAAAGPYQTERSNRGSGTLMDPGSGSLSKSLAPQRCRFGDLSLTGNSVACFPIDADGSVHSLLVSPPAAATITIPLPPNTGAGEVHFSVDGTALIFTIARTDPAASGLWTRDAYAVSSAGGTPRLLVKDVAVIDTTGHPAGALAQLAPAAHGPIVLIDLTTAAVTTILEGGDVADAAGAVGVVCQ